jgi:hypothetical protein
VSYYSQAHEMLQWLTARSEFERSIATLCEANNGPEDRESLRAFAGLPRVPYTS